MRWFVALLQSRKFWITIGACVAAAVSGKPDLIPVILMGEVAAITLEDSASKLARNLNRDFEFHPHPSAGIHKEPLP